MYLAVGYARRPRPAARGAQVPPFLGGAAALVPFLRATVGNRPALRVARAHLRALVALEATLRARPPSPTALRVGEAEKGGGRQDDVPRVSRLNTWID